MAIGAFFCSGRMVAAFDASGGAGEDDFRHGIDLNSAGLALAQIAAHGVGLTLDGDSAGAVSC